MAAGDLEAILSKAERDVLLLASEAGRALDARCDPEILTDCGASNYDACRSAHAGDGGSCGLPPRGFGNEDGDGEFLGGGLYSPPEACVRDDGDGGDDDDGGGGCGALFDFESSSVRLPASVADGPQGNPTDPQVGGRGKGGGGSSSSCAALTLR